MEYSKVKLLANKFLEGSTTEKEEQTLKEYLLQHEAELDGEPKEVAEMMRFFEQEKEILQLDEQFDAKVMQQIASEKQTRVIPFTPVKRYWATAAAVAILLISGLLYQNKQEQKMTDASAQEAMEAYMETKKALMFMSAQLNEGMSYFEQVEEFDRAKQKVKQNK